MDADDPRPALSFVVPVYNEEGNVGPLHAEITATARALGRSYEIVFVDDGSRDRTLERVCALTETDPHLRVVELERNVGEAGALSAGFNTARGDVVITLDGDGQNDPADAPRLLAALEAGYDVASGRRRHREEAFTTRVLPSLIANRLIVVATGVPVYDCGCGLKAYRRQLVDGAQLPRGFNRFLPAILHVDPRRVVEVVVRDRPRGSGASHYGLSRVAIVIRDLAALPLLVRTRIAPRRLAAGLAAAIAACAAGTVVAARTGHPGLAALGVAGTLVGLTARRNVLRMARALEAGVFRVRKVHHGRVTAPDRDRRRGVLGEEPPAYLRQAPHGAHR